MPPRVRYSAGSERPFRAEEFWPSADYEQLFRRLVLAHEPLFKPIIQAMFQGLGVDPHLYDQKLTRTNSGFGSIIIHR